MNLEQYYYLKILKLIGLNNMAHALLISEKTLKQTTLINDNIDPVYIFPAIRISQDVDLQTICGPVLVHKLEDLVASGDIQLEYNIKYKKLLDDYITDYLCWQVMTAIQLNINYKLSNSGTIQNQDDRKYAIDFQNGKNLIAQYQHYSDSYAQKLKNFLDAHTSEYPEYKQCENFEYEETPQLCSIYLEDRPYRHTYIGK